MSGRKIFEGKTLAILSGGGDTPAINSSIESIRNRASILGYKVYGIRHGWKGLLGEGDVIDLSRQPFNAIYGGSALKSSRTNPYTEVEGMEDESRVAQVLNNLEKYKIDVLVTIGGDDTNGAAKKLYENEGIPVIGFPKTIDNDLKTRTCHYYQGRCIESVLCPGFPTAATRIAEFTSILKTTAESHSRIVVMEVMGREAGWLTGAGILGGCSLSLVPEVEMTKERQDFFFERVKELYLSNPKKSLVIPVAEGVKWYDERTGKTDMVFASTEQDEYGHARLGGVSGIISSAITKKLNIDARPQVTGYYPRGGSCSEYDRRLTQALADKVMDLLIRGEYGKMPVMSKITNYIDLEEFNTTSIDMGKVGNHPLPSEYFESNTFTFTDAYMDFITTIIEEYRYPVFDYDFPVVIP